MLKAERPVSPSLDTICVTSARKRKRAFHRIMSGLHAKGSYKFLTLTSGPESPLDIQRSWRRLIMRLQRRGMLKNGYIRVTEYTHQGRAHYHVVFRGDYISQAYISALWFEIHKAPVVYISQVRSKKGISGYLGKYMAKDNKGRLSWSFPWVYQGFARAWVILKRISREREVPFSQVLHYWGTCCRIRRKPREVIEWQLRESYEKELASCAGKQLDVGRLAKLSALSTPIMSKPTQRLFPEGLRKVCGNGVQAGGLLA